MNKLSNLKAQKTKLLKSEVNTPSEFENIQNKLDLIEAQMQETQILEMKRGGTNEINC